MFTKILKINVIKTSKTVNFQSYLCKIIIQAITSFTVHDNWWALKFDSSSKFQSVIMTLCLQKLTCGSPVREGNYNTWIFKFNNFYEF